MMRVDDRDSERCGECGVVPSKGGCACYDDGSGALGAEFRTRSILIMAAMANGMDVCKWRA